MGFSPVAALFRPHALENVQGFYAVLSMVRCV